MGSLCAGSSSITEISRSPYIMIASVLGIGVALITSTLGGFPIVVSASLCFTPKRCCSSVITRPRSQYTTFSWISACVPITKLASFDAISAYFSLFSFAVSDPVSKTGCPKSIFCSCSNFSIA